MNNIQHIVLLVIQLKQDALFNYNGVFSHCADAAFTYELTTVFLQVFMSIDACFSE